MKLFGWLVSHRTAPLEASPTPPEAGRPEEPSEEDPEEVVSSLPWFGEQIVSGKGDRRRGRRVDAGEEQRVLLSWLVGGSSADVAARVPVGRRTVYRVLRRLIYVEDPARLVAHWADLGLIMGVTTGVGRRADIEIACLICHSIVHHTFWLSKPRRLSGRTFRPDPVRQGFDAGRTFFMGSDIQAHLLGHFELGGDPLQEIGHRGWMVRSWVVDDVWSRLPERTLNRAETLLQGGVLDREEELALQEWRRRVLDAGANLAGPVRVTRS